MDMKEGVCSPCPQSECSMNGSPMSEKEIISGQNNDPSNFYLDCWFYRCPEGQLSALNIYRKYKHKNSPAIYLFETAHKSTILESAIGITGRYVVVGNFENEKLLDGDIIVRIGDGNYHHLTNIRNVPKRISPNGISVLE
jgi:hypothetical protein